MAVSLDKIARRAGANGHSHEAKLVKAIELDSKPTPPPAKGKSANVPHANIRPAKYQARKEFDQVKLEELAASIRELGLLQPVIVRPLDDNGEFYELVAGERRWRACKLAGLETVPVLIRNLDDQAAAELGVIENLQREDLNAIEEAEGLQALLKLTGSTQDALAKKLGCTQAHISNRLRLLELPAKPWRAWLISGEISARHARAVLSAVQIPAALKELEKHLAPQVKAKHVETIDEWEDTVRWAIEDNTEAVSGKRWFNGKHVPIVIDEADREALGIVKVTIDGKLEERATNCKLFVERFEARASKAAKSKAKRDDAKEAKVKAAAKKLSPAEAKRVAQIKAEQFKRRLKAWRSDWLRWLCSMRIADNELVATKLLLLYAGQDHRPVPLNHDRFIRDALRETQKEVGSLKDATMQADVDKVIEGFLQRVLWADWTMKGHYAPRERPTLIEDADVESLARELGINLAAAWSGPAVAFKQGPGSQCFAGPMTESYWRIHSSDQLAALAKGWGIYVKEGTPKSKIVALIEGQVKTLPMPAEISPVKGTAAAKAKPAKKAKVKS